MYLNELLLMATWQIKGLQMLGALSLLVLIHEFGHYLFAKIFKTRVDRFYLFFDFLFPFSNVLPFSLFKKKIGDTVYGIGWFPLGGYVKIAGMVDESMDKEQLAQPPQPWEFRSKKAYQRLLIMLGGIFMNILTAIIIYACVFGKWGESYMATSDVKYGIAVDSLGEAMGFQSGDVIQSVNGKVIEKFNNVPLEIALNEGGQVVVERQGVQHTVNVPSSVVGALLKGQKGAFMTARVPAKLDSVLEGSVAEKAGLKSGDSIVAINGQPALYFDEFVKAKRLTGDGSMEVSVIRNGQLENVMLAVTKDAPVGIFATDITNYIPLRTYQYGFFPAIGKGFSYTIDQFVFYWQQFKLLFTSKEVKLSENLGGLGSFAKIFPEAFSWQSFWMLTAFISIILAFMNLLPIPGLDGGHVIFLLWEMLTGRKVNDKVMEIATTVGLVLLLALMVFANGLDVWRFFK